MKQPLRHIAHTLQRCMSVLLLMAAVLTVLVSCDVHEFPETPTHVTTWLHLRFSTAMPQLEKTVGMQSPAKIAATTCLTQGEMRYTVRLYPTGKESVADADAGYKEYVFTRDVADGYDADLKIDAPVGQYTVAVWADLDSEHGGQHAFYSAADFHEIVLNRPHTGNTDYRDAFRGTATLSIAPDCRDDETTAEATIEMERPLAKFEFVTNDVTTFLKKQTQKALASATRMPALDDYRLVFYYYGFMPCSFNLFTDKPVDSATGVSFSGRITQLNSNEASLGFDYVFVNHLATEVTVQMAIYDTNGTLLSTSAPINVPLKRSHHTIVRGAFLTQNTTDGIGIKADYDGEYNLIY